MDQRKAHDEDIGSEKKGAHPSCCMASITVYGQCTSHVHHIRASRQAACRHLGESTKCASSYADHARFFSNFYFRCQT